MKRLPGLRFAAGKNMPGGRRAVRECYKQRNAIHFGHVLATSIFEALKHPIPTYTELASVGSVARCFWLARSFADEAHHVLSTFFRVFAIVTTKDII